MVTAAPVQAERHVSVTPVFERIEAASATGKRFIIVYGGAGTGKSHAMAQFMIKRATTYHNRVIGVSRKTLPALKLTAMKNIVNMLKRWGYYNEKDHNKTDLTLALSSNVFEFFSMGDADDKVSEEKIKSRDFTDEWIEESTEYTHAEMLQLNLRLRAPYKKGEPPNQMFFSFNPIDENHWIKTELVDKAEEMDVCVVHTTYLDNQYLDDAYIQQLENLKKIDPNKYRVYALGEWGRLDDLVYPNWSECSGWPVEVKSWAYGLDFGYESPLALIKVGMGYDGCIYLEEMVYENHLQIPKLIERLSHLDRGDIYADSASPAFIDQIQDAGYSIYPCKKGAGSIVAGLNLLKSYPIKITKSSVETTKEIRGYMHKRDKDNRLIDDPVPYNDHAMDAARYSVEGQVDRYGFATSGSSSTKTRSRSFANNKQGRRPWMPKGLTRVS